MSTLRDDSLYCACFNGEKHRILKLVNQNNVSYVDRIFGDTPLHQACKQGWLDVVKLFIEKYDCDTNVKTKGNRSVLHYACQYGHVNLLELIIEKYGCDPNVVTKSNESLLHYACHYGHIDIVEYLINKQHLNPFLRENINQLEPLDYAISNNETDIVVYICQHCISSDDMLNPDRIKTTINLTKYIATLFLRGRMSVTNPLDPRWQTVDGDNVLQLVGSSKTCISHIPSVIVLEFLKGDVSKFNPDWRTADNDNLLELVCQSEIFLSRTPSTLMLERLGVVFVNQVKWSIPDSKTADGDPLIQLVCQSETCIAHTSTAVISKWLRRTKLIQNLIKIITPKWKTADGHTLLQLVCRSKEIVSHIPSTVLTKWLTDSSTTMDVIETITPYWRTADCVTLFQLICQSKKCLIQISSPVFLEWLRKTPLNFVKTDRSLAEHKTADGDTLLQLILRSPTSISKTSTGVLVKLLSYNREISINEMKNVNPKWKTLDGTPFVHALCRSNIEDKDLIELMQYYILEKCWSDYNIMNSKGNTVLHIACETNKHNLMTYLIDQAQCDPNRKNTKGDLPLDMTTNPEVINHLCQYHQVSLYSKTLVGWITKWWLINDATMLSIVQSLVNNRKTVTEDGSTLLHVLCTCITSRNTKSLVEYLLAECQCDPNCLDSKGQTPLQLTSNSEIMKTLVEHGAKMSSDVVFKVISPKIGDSTAIELFALSSRKGTMLWNPTGVNRDGKTALDFAYTLNKPAIVNHLLTEATCDPSANNI